MRKARFTASLIIVLMALTTAAEARRYELTPYVGYRWGGELRDISQSTDGALFKLSFENAANVGVAFDLVTTVPYLLFQVFWDRQFSELRAQDNQTGVETQLGKVNIDNIHFGIIYELSTMYNYSDTPPVRPYLGFTFGGARFAPRDDSIDTEWRFGIGFVLGIKYFFGERIGLRAQSRIMTTYFNSNTETFCDDAGRCYNLADAGFMNQFDLTLGLIFSF